MMDPTHNTKQPLVNAASTRRALLAAWLDVKPRVTHSKNPKIRADADAFGRNLETSFYRLQRALRSGTFAFEPQHGVLKRSKTNGATKPPRPLVVAPVVSRVVQRAILNVCQSKNSKIQKLLGRIPEVIATRTSVGGLPKKGVPEAMFLIREAIANGACWYVRSDLKKFFQTIPKPRIETFLVQNIKDENFVALFMQALATELENEEEVRELIHLFPIGDTGVPQGSALSALCANIVLEDFDRELNNRGICTVRYLDDFVIMGSSKAATMKAWASAQEILCDLGMECHDPRQGTGKASMGEVSGGFEFLSFHIDDADIFPSAEARNGFVADLAEVIKQARRIISAAADEPRRAEPRFFQYMGLLDRKIRGWGDAFAPTTKRVVLGQLDAKIDIMIGEFSNWFERYSRGHSRSHLRRLRGIALVADSLVLSSEKREGIDTSPIRPLVKA